MVQCQLEVNTTITILMWKKKNCNENLILNRFEDDFFWFHSKTK